jgi:NitT/TauT family transport system ATP-binding protein
MAKPLISFEDISLHFPLKQGGRHQVFSGLNLAIEEGEFVTILGETGCGKSTLLRILLGSEHPAAGRVLVGSRAVTQPNRDRGYVPQKYSLFPDKTVVKNVMFGPLSERFALYKFLSPKCWAERRTLHQDALDYLRRVGLSERDSQKYPDQLSGGMQQRVAIAQSLIMDPKILLMDESFSALDPVTRTGMQRLLRSIWRETNKTVVFVTHNLAEAIYLGSRVILLGKNGASDCSEIVLDMNVPDSIRWPDGTPKQEEMERLTLQIGAASSQRLLSDDFAAALAS